MCPHESTEPFSQTNHPGKASDTDCTQYTLGPIPEEIGKSRDSASRARRRTDRNSYYDGATARRRKKRLLLAPIHLGMALSLSTLCLYYFGAWDFPYRDNWTLATFLLIYNLSLYLGFRLGTSVDVYYTPRHSPLATSQFVRKIRRTVMFITVVTLIPRFMIDTGLYDSEIATLLYRVEMGMNDAYLSYNLNREIASVSGIWAYINYVCVATGFISWLYTGLAIMTWTTLRPLAKAFTWTYWGILLLQSIAQGTNYGVFDLGIQIMVFYAIKKATLRGAREHSKLSAEHLSGRVPRATLRFHRTAPSRTSIGRATLAVLSVVTLLVVAFNNTMSSRVGTGYRSLLSYGGLSVEIDRTSFFWNIWPESIQPLIATLTAYISHGYVGLAMALDVPFTSTYGVGHSWFLIYNFEEATGLDVLQRTYLMGIEYQHGYDHKILWHTAYLWFANDVSLYGVPIVLFTLMFIYGFAWKDYLTNGNLFAVGMMSTFGLFFFFLSANNQVFSSYNSLFAFWVLLFVWLATRRKFDWSSALK